MGTLIKSELTKSELARFYTDTDKIIAKALRDHNVFMPLGLEIMNYEILPVDRCLFKHDSPAWVNHMTCQIFINVKSEFFDKCTNSGMTFTQVFSTLLMHEILHPLLFHGKRMGHRDPEIWNIACDFVINLLLANLESESSAHYDRKLVDLNIRSIPKDNICLSDNYAGKIEEEVYNELINQDIKKEEYYISLEDFNKATGNQGEEGEDSDEGGEGEDEQDGGGNPKVSQDPNEIDGPAVKITEIELEVDGRTVKKTEIQFPDIPPGSEEEEKKQKKRQRNLGMNKKNFENTLMKGVNSEHLKAFLGKLFKVPIDFEKILKDSLMTALQKGQDQIWHKPRTIWMVNALGGMPYLPNVDDEEVRGVAFFSIDESGSMSNEDIKKAIAIVVAAWEYYKVLVIIKHDHEAAEPYIFTKESELHDDKIDELCHRIRCGGTSHRDVFHKCNEYLKEHPEELASVYVGCTDLMSDLERCQNDLPSYIPRIWIVNSDYRVDGLVGRVIRLK